MAAPLPDGAPIVTPQVSKPTRLSRHDEWRQTLLQAWNDKRSLPTFPPADDQAWMLFQTLIPQQEAP